MERCFTTIQGNNTCVSGLFPEPGKLIMSFIFFANCIVVGFQSHLDYYSELFVETIFA